MLGIRVFFGCSIAFIFAFAGCCECKQPPKSVIDEARAALEHPKLVSPLTPRSDLEAPASSAPPSGTRGSRMLRALTQDEKRAADIALAAWKKAPTLKGAEFSACKLMRNGGKGSGHGYFAVPGLPECAEIFCYLREGCRGGHEACLDLQSCHYVGEEGKAHLPETCYVPKTAGPTDNF